MTITDFFESLGAPLANSRWSWGAIRPSDGAVFLRVWQDGKFVEQGIMHMWVLGELGRTASGSVDLGYRERESHVARVRQGAPCYLIMCRAVDPKATPRKIASFSREHVFKGGPLIERADSTYIQVQARLSVSEIAV